MTQPQATKKCSMCGAQKPLSDFHHCHRRGDGRQTSCKDCSHAYGKRYYRLMCRARRAELQCGQSDAQKQGKP
jgi:hypothetical protein